MNKVNINKEARAISSVCLCYGQAGVVLGCKMAFFTRCLDISSENHVLAAKGHLQAHFSQDTL